MLFLIDEHGGVSMHINTPRPEDMLTYLPPTWFVQVVLSEGIDPKPWEECYKKAKIITLPKDLLMDTIYVDYKYKAYNIIGLLEVLGER